MTVFINIPRATGAELRKRAAAYREDPATYVLRLVRKELAPARPRRHRSKLDFKQRMARLEAWTASHAPLPYLADDSRESIYADDGA